MPDKMARSPDPASPNPPDLSDPLSLTSAIL
ncbi:hypothetical protein AQ1_01773 [alpha proteobacterium Q-1]|nr:hypothetical protein AQ1_01773 [alpha proteobacterium Q-1]